MSITSQTGSPALVRTDTVFEQVAGRNSEYRKLCGGSFQAAFHRKVIGLALLETFLGSSFLRTQTLLAVVFGFEIFRLGMSLQVTLLQQDEIGVFEGGEDGTFLYIIARKQGR